MKKVIIASVILVILAGASIGAYFAVKSKSEKENQKQAESLADNVLFNVDSDSINKIQIFYSDNNYTAEIMDSDWILTESSTNERFALNQTIFQGICTSIANLTADTSYGEATDENKAKYGLNDPYKIVFSDGEASYILYIGDKSPTGDYYYAYTDTKNNIYAITASDAESIITTNLSIKDDKFLSYTSNQITGMSLKKDGKTIYELTLNPESNLWELPSEYSMLTVNQTRPTSIITLITRLTAEEMFVQSDDDIVKYGFDNPTAEFTVQLSDGTECSYLMSSYGKNTESYTYVYLEHSKQVETYYTADMKFINYDIFDLIPQTIENANMYAISDFEIICPELCEKFTINATDDYAECRGYEIDLSKAQIKSYFETFYNYFSYTVITDIDVESKPELENPVFTVKYTNSDGTKSQIDLVSTGEDNKCFVFADEKYTGTITDSDFVISGMLESYKLLCSQAEIQPNN